MWRTVKEIPRVLRAHWVNSFGSCPQVAGHDDQTGKKEPHTLCANSLHLKKVPCDENDENGNPGGPGGGKHEPPRQDTTYNIRSFNGLEAMGWGTALVLGLQMCQLWKRDDQHHMQVNRRWLQSNWYDTILRIAFSMPQTDRVARNVIGGSQPKQSADGSSSKNVQKTHFAQTAEVGKPVPEGNEEFGESWENLTRMYDGLKCNAKAIQMAEQGKHDQAKRLWSQASKLGCAKASYNLGLWYEQESKKSSVKKAVEQYTHGALAGHSGSQYNLAMMYLQGRGVTRNDDHALKLLEKAASQGLVQAQTGAGVLQFELNTEDSLTRAAKWFQRAADQMDPCGLYYLGLCYENGLGVENNTCKAAELYSRAANTGHAEAQYNLGLLFESGLGGLPEDRSSALDLYEKSFQNGHTLAAEKVEKLKTQLDDTQYKEMLRDLTNLAVSDDGFSDRQTSIMKLKTTDDSRHSKIDFYISEDEGDLENFEPLDINSQLAGRFTDSTPLRSHSSSCLNAFSSGQFYKNQALSSANVLYNFGEHNSQIVQNCHYSTEVTGSSDKVQPISKSCSSSEIYGIHNLHDVAFVTCI